MACHTDLLLHDLRSADGEVAQEVNELSGLAAISRDLRPQCPHQVQQNFFVAGERAPVRV